MNLCFHFIGSGLGACSTLTVSPITNLTGWLSKPFLHLVQGLFGVLTVGESLPEVLHFFLEHLRFATYCLCPVSKSIYYTIAESYSFTLAEGDGGYPTVDIDPCGWTFYIQ